MAPKHIDNKHHHAMFAFQYQQAAPETSPYLPGNASYDSFAPIIHCAMCKGVLHEADMPLGISAYKTACGNSVCFTCANAMVSKNLCTSCNRYLFLGESAYSTACNHPFCMACTVTSLANQDKSPTCRCGVALRYFTGFRSILTPSGRQLSIFDTQSAQNGSSSTAACSDKRAALTEKGLKKCFLCNGGLCLGEFVISTACDHRFCWACAVTSLRDHKATCRCGSALRYFTGFRSILDASGRRLDFFDTEKVRKSLYIFGRTSESSFPEGSPASTEEGKADFADDDLPGTAMKANVQEIRMLKNFDQVRCNDTVNVHACEMIPNDTFDFPGRILLTRIFPAL